jgi:hypothetical protein
MAAQASAKAPQAPSQTAIMNHKQAAAPSQWDIWKQVVIAELLNVLDNRRYDVSL